MKVQGCLDVEVEAPEVQRCLNVEAPEVQGYLDVVEVEIPA